MFVALRCVESMVSLVLGELYTQILSLCAILPRTGAPWPIFVSSPSVCAPSIHRANTRVQYAANAPPALASRSPRFPPRRLVQHLLTLLQGGIVSWGGTGRYRTNP
jgi:hypothetical protein